MLQYQSNTHHNYKISLAVTFGITKADKYAFALLDALFSEDKLANSCYKATDRSKKGPLNEEKIYLLKGQNEL